MSEQSAEQDVPRCPACRHAPHGQWCANLASDNECSCTHVYEQNAEIGGVRQSVQHRCPRMAEHHRVPPNLPIPCPGCYSVRVTAERIPWEPNVRWHSLPSEPDGTT